MALIAGLAGLVLASGCSSSSSNGATSQASQASHASKTYTVEAFVPLSGVMAAIGAAERVALTIGVEAANSTGGIDGQHIVLTVKDSMGDPSVASGLAQSIVSSSSRPDLVIDTYEPTVQAIVPILSGSNVLVMTPTEADAVMIPSKYPLFFSTSVLPSDVYGAIAAFLKSKDVKSIGFIGTNDANGENNMRAGNAEFKVAGIKVTSASFDPTTVDLTPQLLQLKAAKPQYLVIDANGAPAGVALVSRAKLAWSIPTIGDTPVAVTPLQGLVTPNQVTNVKLLALKELIANSQKSASFTKFYSLLKRQTKVDVTILAYSNTYDILQLVQAAAKQAGSTDPKAIANALEHLKQPANPPWVTAASYDFSPTSHAPQFAPSEFTFVDPAPSSGGLIQVGQPLP
jgi:branched-chain amino acid transport system substrate-binding protein